MHNIVSDIEKTAVCIVLDKFFVVLYCAKFNKIFCFMIEWFIINKGGLLMNQSIEKMKAYFAENPLKNENGNVTSLTEELFWYYMENNPLVNEKIRSLYNQSDSYFAHLSLKEIDAVFDTFSDLCLEQEKLAFQGGIRLGTQLMLELLGQAI